MVTVVTVPDENQTWFNNWCQKFGWQLSNRMGQSNTRPRSSVMKLDSNLGYRTYGSDGDVIITSVLLFDYYKVFDTSNDNCLRPDILHDNVNYLQSKHDETEGT